jgi:hypothetical protein
MMPLVVVFIFIVYVYFHMDGLKVVPKHNPKQKDISIVNINKGIECINLYFVKLFYMINSCNSTCRLITLSMMQRALCGGMIW